LKLWSKSRSPWAKTHFSALSVACMRFVFNFSSVQLREDSSHDPPCYARDYCTLTQWNIMSSSVRRDYATVAMYAGQISLSGHAVSCRRLNKRPHLAQTATKRRIHPTATVYRKTAPTTTTTTSSTKNTSRTATCQSPAEPTGGLIMRQF